MKVLFNNNAANLKMFAGRTAEISSLTNALKAGDGGTILISGDRGSGKTRLIKEATDSVKIKKLGRTIFTDKTIDIEIPLITPIKDDNGELNKEALRGLLLRSIVHALWAEYTAQYWTRYRSLNYRRKLKKLVKRTEYSKIIRGLNVGAGLQNFHGSGINSALNRSWQGELDLSDIKLELYLTDLLKSYSNKYRFIIVFDELDKFEDDNTTPVDYIEKLKNFFTASKATFIFVSTETFYGSMQKRIQASPYSKEHTLFSKSMLINQISPKEFTKLIDEIFEKQSRDKASREYQFFRLALMWHTNLYPYDLQRALDELRNHSEAKSYIEMDDAKKFFSNLWDYHAPLLELVNYSYGLHSEPKDSYYNRYLYKALREVLGSIVTEKEIKFNSSNALTALFLPDSFENEVTTASYDAFIATGNMPSEEAFLTGWKEGLYNLTTSQIHAVERAIMTLLWLADKCQYISINKNESFTEGFAVSVSLNEELVFVNNTDDKFNSAIKNLDATEKKIVEDIKKYNHLSRKFLNEPIEQALDDEILRFYVSITTRPADTMSRHVDGLRNRFSYSKKIISQKLVEFHDTTLMDNLISRADELLRKEIATSNTLIDVDDQIGKYVKMPIPEGGSLLIAFNLKSENQKRLVDEPDFKFIFSINDIEDTEYILSAKFKEHKLAKLWGNYETVLKKVEQKAKELRFKNIN